MMCMATTQNNKPWACTVYYVVDNDLNLYWASPEETNHSQHIKNNENVSVAIPVTHKKSQPVVGMQIEGKAEQVQGIENIKPVAEKYAKEYGFGEKWIEKFSSDKTKHKLYKLSPSRFVLFDDVKFPDSPRKEWIP